MPPLSPSPELDRLKRPTVRDQLDGLLDEAGRQKVSPRETLVLLCECEIAFNDERRIEMTVARFPFCSRFVSASNSPPGRR